MEDLKVGVWQEPKKKNITRSTSHVIVGDEKPYCGTTTNPQYRLRFLSMGLNMDYVTCSKCQKLIEEEKPPVEPK
jgi:hypothetical protein